MVTNAEVEELETREEWAESLARTVIAGHPQGAVRRITLYVILAALTVLGIGIDGVVGLGLGALALVVLMLLAMTDSLA